MKDATQPDLKIVPPEGGPGQTTDDGKGQADPANADARSEGIFKRAGKVFSKYGVTFRKGPGRPRLDGSPGKADEIISKIPAAGPVPGQAVAASLDPSLDQAFIQDCLQAATEGLVAFGDSQLKRVATRVSGDKNYAAALVSNTTPSKPELERIAKLEALLIKKYQIDTKYLCEFALAFCVIGIGTRYMTAMTELRQFADPDDHESKIVRKMGGTDE